MNYSQFLINHIRIIAVSCENVPAQPVGMQETVDPVLPLGHPRGIDRAAVAVGDDPAWAPGVIVPAGPRILLADVQAVACYSAWRSMVMRLPSGLRRQASVDPERVN